MSISIRREPVPSLARIRQLNWTLHFQSPFYSRWKQMHILGDHPTQLRIENSSNTSPDPSGRSRRKHHSRLRLLSSRTTTFKGSLAHDWIVISSKLSEDFHLWNAILFSSSSLTTLCFWMGYICFHLCVKATSIASRLAVRVHLLMRRVALIAFKGTLRSFSCSCLSLLDIASVSLLSSR